jgi:hypothetical protein
MCFISAVRWSYETFHPAKEAEIEALVWQGYVKVVSAPPWKWLHPRLRQITGMQLFLGHWDKD